MVQQLINRFYRVPKSKWKEIRRFGGYISYLKVLKGKKEMFNASKSLPPIFSHQGGLNIYFLTGKKYLYQTLFCAFSLVKVSPKETFQFILVDDGSFDDEFISQINSQMPNAKIITKTEIENNLGNRLPKLKYPYLNDKREIYPHIKKLTDIHTLDENPYKLVLDSDMLFWNEPVELINWLKQPNGCIYMLDCVESYGFDTALMQSLCGHEIPRLMNVGAIGIQSSTINWDHLETWGKTLEEKEGPSYFLEQALSAMIVSNQDKAILSKEEYIVNPEQGANNSNLNKLHHYVDLSKKYYFGSAWKTIYALSTQTKLKPPL